jgi:hypothetical protein
MQSNKEQLPQTRTSLKSDQGYLDQYSNQSFKTLRHYTENFNDPTVNLNKLVTMQAEFMDANNFLSRVENVSQRMKTVLPPLPLLTNPSLRYSGSNIQTDSNLRPVILRDRKSCNPKETRSYIRSFSIFDNGTVPQIYNTRENPGVQDSHSLRGGIDSRMSKYTYK